MKIAIMDCAALNGFGATKVRVEVDISRGLPAFLLVGLPENSVKEARMRVQSAINNAGFDFPRGKILVNLAPADLQKSGTSFDLTIALAILQAEGILPEPKLQGIAAIGELSLSAEIRPVKGILALAESIKEQGFKTLLVAKENAQEASLIKDLTVRVVKTFGEIVKAVMAQEVEKLPKADAFYFCEEPTILPDMNEVVGQEEARRALLIAAAGHHNLLFFGGPGSGKSMMAHRMPSILPPLSYDESLVLTKIYSIAGLTMSGKLINKRPFRAPHHSTTRAGLVGGGSKNIRPGEVSLASFGVLFLDEILEFPRAVLEVLRQPLEDGYITLSRANLSVTYPAKLSLVAALNPCPCGHFGQKNQQCQCSSVLIERYQSRLSGPVMDRMDLFVNVPPVDLAMMHGASSAESSASMREKVIRARARQHERLKNNLTNGQMSRRDIKEHANLSPNALKLLLKCGESLSISARGFDRIIRVARTIADLDDAKDIDEKHICEAVHYRPAKSLRN